jgi:PAS domain-containing protein
MQEESGTSGRSGSFEQLLLDYADEMLLLVDPASLDIRAANRTACDRLGYGSAELLAKKITDVESALADVFFWQDVQAGGGGELENAEGLYRSADGSLLTQRPISHKWPRSCAPRSKRRWTASSSSIPATASSA